MKRILFTCCILAASFSATIAQTTPTASTADFAQFKSSFTAKINQLSNFLSANDSVSAMPVFNDVKYMMEQELGATKQQIGTATTEDDKKAARSKSRKQLVLYSQAMAAMHAGIINNRTLLNSSLSDFYNTL
jgi:hypothetical protein